LIPGNAHCDDEQPRPRFRDSSRHADLRESSILDETRAKFSEKPAFPERQSQSLTVSHV
jgi:hypothetical protein